jgi:hypothetical protein
MKEEEEAAAAKFFLALIKFIFGSQSFCPPPSLMPASSPLSRIHEIN